MLRLIPLGGLGEIGLNSMAVEAAGEVVLVDAGLMFPTRAMPGVDIVLPDYSYLLNSPSKLKGVVLTHGHEDHVGALYHLLRDHKVPVWGLPFTLHLVRKRLDEFGIKADLRPLEPRVPFKVGEHTTVEAVRVTHSVPDGVAVVIRTPAGTVVHTGDFKLDPTPIDGFTTDLGRLEEIGEEGVDFLLSDSTGSELAGHSGSEQDVANSFEKILAKSEDRVIVAMFASNVHRSRHLIQLAEKLGRKVALVGRGLQRNVEAARELGYLPCKDSTFIPPEAAETTAPGKVLILTTGAQAEPRAGLSQMLSREYAGPQIHPYDHVILSARAIPGNEREVSGLVDALLRRGAKVTYARIDPSIHCSGHASRDEQQKMMTVVRPKHFVPIHGEYKHLVHHRENALAAGLPAESIHLIENGDILEAQHGGVRRAGKAPIGRIFMDRYGGGEVMSPSLKERDGLAELGVVVAVVVINRSTNALMAGPLLQGKGLNQEELAVLDLAATEARTMFVEMSPELRGDEERVKEEVTRAVRRAFKQYVARRPTVLPVVVKL